MDISDIRCQRLVTRFFYQSLTSAPSLSLLLQSQHAERSLRVREYAAFVPIVFFDELHYFRVRQVIHLPGYVEYQARPRAAQVFDKIRARLFPERRIRRREVSFR